VTGWLADDAASWRAALEACARDAVQRRAMGHAVREKVLQLHSTEAVAHAQVAPWLTSAMRRRRAFPDQA